MAEIQQLRADILELDREIRRLRAEQQQRGAGDFVRANAIIGVVPSANVPAHGSIGLWTNQSGGALGIGAVVIQNGDRQFDTTVTADDLDVVGVLTEAIANTAEGRLRHQGYHPSVIVEGAVVAGQFLRTSTTAGAAEDAGTIPTEGVFGMALTATAGPGAGTVAAYLFGTIGALTANSVYMPRVAGSTYDDAEDANTLFGSAGWFSGGVISDNGDGTVAVTAGTGVLRSAATATTQLLFIDWGADASEAIPVGTTRYIGVEWNGGTPRVTTRTTDNLNHFTDFELGIAVREPAADGGTIHIQQHEHHAGDAVHTVIERWHQTEHIRRDNELNGNILGESGDNNRNVQVSAGAYWVTLDRFATGAFDSSGADTFDTYSAGGREAAGVSVWPNLQYDNGGVLANLGGNKWANLWWYQDLNSSIVMIYGTAQYNTEAMAGEEAVPTTVPDRVVVHGLLIGRYIFQNGDTIPSQVQTIFVDTFNVAGVTDHGGLDGLLDDDHTIYLLADGTRALTGDWAAGAFSITADNVTIKDGSIELHHGTDTIAGDEIIAPTGGYIIAAAQAGVADDLDGIGGGAYGRIIVVRADAGDTITIRHNDAGGGAGRKILLNDNADLALVGNDEDNVTLMYDESLLGAAGAWFEITRSGLDASAVTYTPAVLADWDGDADPGDVDDALDELAERTTDIEERGVYEGKTSSTLVFGESGIWYGNTPFVGTINGAPLATSIVYTPTSGENSIFPGTVIHNTTLGERALITAVNYGTNTLTVEADSPDDVSGWANTNAITTASQTNVGRGGIFVDIDVTRQMVSNSSATGCAMFGVTGRRNADDFFVIVHPYAAWDNIAEQTIARMQSDDNRYSHWVQPLGSADGRHYFTLCLLNLAADNCVMQGVFQGQFTKLVS